jgi:23S rRNA (uracil1939-C5)-methyltransferase
VLQDLAYSDQLVLKQNWLEQHLQGFTSEPIAVVGLEDPWRYRNKVEFSFGEVGGEVVLGYHSAGSFVRIVPIADCLLVPESMQAPVAVVQDLAHATGLPAYNPKRHSGVFRQVVVRYSHLTQQLLLIIVTTAAGQAAVEAMVEPLCQRVPALSGILWARNDTVADVVQPAQVQLLWGDPFLETRVGAYTVRLHALSFLQASSIQAERIYRHVAEQLHAYGGSVAWDIYCGLGLLGFYLAEYYQRVYGVEVEARTLELARENAQRNRCDACIFYAGPAEDVLADRRFWLQQAHPDVVALDPPRAGCQTAVLATVLAARPRAIAYVSCNAQSLARDLALLSRSYPRYRVKQVLGFDLFPQTHHVEAVALLERA